MVTLKIEKEEIFLPNHFFYTQLLGDLSDMMYHSHNFYEIMYVISGEVTHHINNTKELLKAGDIIFLRPGDCHKLVCGDNSESFFHRDILIDVTLLNKVLNFLDNDTVKAGLEKSCFKSSISAAHIEFLEEGFRHIEALPDSQQKNMLIYSALCSIITSLSASFSQEMVNNSKLNYPLWLNQLISLLNNTSSFKRSKKEILNLIASLNYNPSYISRAFKKYTGQTLIAYLNKLRFSTAHMLIQNTDMSIDRIVDYIGLNSKTYFYREFKKRYGVTPKQINKQPPT